MTDRSELAIYERMVRSLEGQRFRLVEERAALQQAMRRIAEIDEDIALIDAELATVRPKYERVRPQP